MRWLALMLAWLGASAALYGMEIVIPDEPGMLVFPPGEGYYYPAEFLQRHIFQATGKKLPIVKESAASASDSKIYVGNTTVAKKYNFQCKPEELILQPHGNHLVITGEITPDGVDRGTLFGVYEFLERQLGIRFFYADNPRWSAYGPGTVIPKQEKITFPVSTIRSAPIFRQREGGVGYYNAKLPVQKLWHPVLRFGSTLPRQNANHTQIYWHELYSKSHPEYFAKDSHGKPVINDRLVYRNYICLSNDAVLRQMMENIADFDDRKPGADKAFGPRPPWDEYVYFACNDGMIPKNTCHCEECEKRMQKEKNYEAQGSELFFRFASRYAKAINERYPGRKLAVLAYSHYLAPPGLVNIPDNMEVTYVGPPIHYCANPKLYKMHKNYVRRWNRILGDRMRMTLWLNIVSPQIYLSNCPFMYHHTFQKFMRENLHTFVGVFINGLCPYLRRLGDRGLYGTIHTLPMVYLQGRLLWDVKADVDELLADYCQKSYGKGAEAMLEYYKLISDRWEGRYQDNDSMHQFDYIHRIRYPQEVVARMKTLLNQAADASKEEPECHGRIVYLRDKVYSRFFQESEEYHRTSGLRRVYECLPVETPPEIDGNDDDLQWQNTYPLELTKFQRGEESPRKSLVKMVYHEHKLYFLVEFHNVTPKDELRIQSAIKFDAMAGIYAPNINRNWRTFAELRIDQQGKATRYGSFPQCEYQVSRQGDRWIVEGALPYTRLATGVPTLPSMRLQFLRYADVWNDYDTTAPALGGISDYPTWRFLIVDLLPPSKVTRDGLE